MSGEPDKRGLAKRQAFIFFVLRFFVFALLSVDAILLVQ